MVYLNNYIGAQLPATDPHIQITMELNWMKKAHGVGLWRSEVTLLLVALCAYSRKSLSIVRS